MNLISKETPKNLNLQSTEIFIIDCEHENYLLELSGKNLNTGEVFSTLANPATDFNLISKIMNKYNIILDTSKFIFIDSYYLLGSKFNTNLKDLYFNFFKDVKALERVILYAINKKLIDLPLNIKEIIDKREQIQEDSIKSMTVDQMKSILNHFGVCGLSSKSKALVQEIFLDIFNKMKK